MDELDPLRLRDPVPVCAGGFTGPGLDCRAALAYRLFLFASAHTGQEPCGPAREGACAGAGCLPAMQIRCEIDHDRAGKRASLRHTRAQVLPLSRLP
jgi:hypothetical protein